MKETRPVVTKKRCWISRRINIKSTFRKFRQPELWKKDLTKNVSLYCLPKSVKLPIHKLMDEIKFVFREGHVLEDRDEQYLVFLEASDEQESDKRITLNGFSNASMSKIVICSFETLMEEFKPEVTEEILLDFSANSISMRFVEAPDNRKSDARITGSRLWNSCWSTNLISWLGNLTQKIERKVT